MLKPQCIRTPSLSAFSSTLSAAFRQIKVLQWPSSHKERCHWRSGRVVLDFLGINGWEMGVASHENGVYHQDIMGIEQQ
jgi:hypothetical protein